MICTHCVMDSSVEDIAFDHNGQCQYCREYPAKQKRIVQGSEALEKLLGRIRSQDKKYNCIVGISGGLDSSFLLYEAVRLGLRPLAVHIDTGWNTETSVSNIRNLTECLNTDLHTFVLNWEQFREVQIAYLRSGVIDLEFPTDHYYLAGLYKVAADKGIRYMLTGNNFSSEGIMPDCWIHNKGDTRNMLDIYAKHGKGKSIDDLPTLGLGKKFYYYNVLRIQNIFFLNYSDYNREVAARILRSECGWRQYPVKHGESVFTRFYQRYILPLRFGADYRKAHLSSLICNGQLQRKDALEELAKKPDADWDPSGDKNYVMKKLGLSEKEFEEMLSQPVKKHGEFRTEMHLKKIYNILVNALGMQAVFKTSNRH